MSQGDKVVYMVQSLYTGPARRAAFSKVEISPWSVAEFYWMRMLWPLTLSQTASRPLHVLVTRLIVDVFWLLPHRPDPDCSDSARTQADSDELRP